jgi:hypothetical protein
MLSTLAETAPSAMASSVRSASGVASSEVMPPGPPSALPGLTAVPTAAPTISSSAQDRNSPVPDHHAIPALLASGLK